MIVPEAIMKIGAAFGGGFSTYRQFILTSLKSYMS